MSRPPSTIHILGLPSNETNVELPREWSAHGMDATLTVPEACPHAVRPGDVVLGRLDVLATLDGVEPGLAALLRLERSGVHVLNRAAALYATHDKIVTAHRLAAAGLPHPRTRALNAGLRPPLEPPLVLKPRFGSWGRDVLLCRDGDELARGLDAVRHRSWFRRRGALVQALVPPRGYDLRLIVAGGAVVGACERVAAAGEWRTNISLGGTLRPVEPPPEACTLGVAAARTLGADLVGVDLMPAPAGSFVVLELNGAVDFDGRYSLQGRDVYLDAAEALGLAAAPPPLRVQAALG